MPETRYSVSRANARFAFIAEAEVAEVGNGPRFVARVSELSSRGCYVDTVNPFPDGTKLRISIRYGCSTCDFTGSVIYTHPGFGMGVRFGETTAASRATLDAWLDELARNRFWRAHASLEALRFHARGGEGLRVNVQRKSRARTRPVQGFFRNFRKRSAMTALLSNGFFLVLVKVYGAFLILGPVLLRIQFRFNASLNPRLVPVESLPPDVQQFMAPRVQSIAGLGFDPVGYVNVGKMTSGTGSFMALFSNPRTMEWANVSVVKSASRMAGYIEFITRCSDDAQVDTNTNSTPSVLFPLPSYHVFRFPQVK